MNDEELQNKLLKKEEKYSMLKAHCKQVEAAFEQLQKERIE